MANMPNALFFSCLKPSLPRRGILANQTTSPTMIMPPIIAAASVAEETNSGTKIGDPIIIANGIVNIQKGIVRVNWLEPLGEVS
jgi:hypothetical protein